MQKLTEVLAMGGYAMYVWPSYLLAAAVMTGLVVASVRSLRRSQRALVELRRSPTDET